MLYFPVDIPLRMTETPSTYIMGAADTSIALATASIKEMLNWLDQHHSG